MPTAALAASREFEVPRADGYVRHRPEESLLYQVVEEHWPDFRQRAEEAGGLPRFVVREFESFLKCGILENGLARLACRRCGHEMVIGFSCKKRGLCPSCCGRRMADIAAHLVEAVLPPAPGYRQWVCSLPPELRIAVAFDRRLCAEVLDAFASSLLRHLRWRVKRDLHLASVADALPGAITFVQRSDSSLRVWPHFHTLAADGAWVRVGDGKFQFHDLGEPTAADVAQVARWTYERLVRVLERHGRSESLASDQPVLASCYGASAADIQLLGADPGERTAKLFGPVSCGKPQASGLAAEVGGVNVHAGTAVDGRDRRRLERVCRYMARPPVCQERLQRQGESLRYEFKKAWRSGTKAVLLSPLDFIARLCALVPPPRFHTLRYHGAFAGGSAVRREIVPVPEPQPGQQVPLFESERSADPRQPRHLWPWLLRHVFAVDVSVCPVAGCGGAMRVVDIAAAPDHTARVLAELGLAPRGRPPPRPYPLPARQLALPI